MAATATQTTARAASALARSLTHKAVDLGFDTMVGSLGVAAHGSRRTATAALRSARRQIESRRGRTGPLRRRLVRSRDADWSLWSSGSQLSFGSMSSRQSALSAWSMLSFGSVASLGSAVSVGSVGSVGSVLSVGSAGSILSIGSAGSILAIGGRNQRPAWFTRIEEGAPDGVGLALVQKGATVLGSLALMSALRSA